MKIFSTGIYLLLAAVITAPIAAAPIFHYPPAPTGNAVDTFFGHKVVDPYRPLENAADPRVKAWAQAETALAVQYIHSRPTFSHYSARVRELLGTAVSRYDLRIVANRYFYLKETPPQAQAQLIVRDGLHGAERVLFDPQKQEMPSPPAIESWYISPDGSKVAFTTQLGGTEDETLRIVDATSAKLLADVLPHVGGGESPTALAWDGDSNGFLHTLWPKKPDGTYATSNIELVHHVIGTDPATDTYVFGRGLSPKAEYFLLASLDGKMQAAVESDGDGVHASLYLRKAGGAFNRAASPADGIGSSSSAGCAFVGDVLYAISSKWHDRGDIVAIAPGTTFVTSKVVVPASAGVIESIVPVRNGFITNEVDGGDSTAHLFDRDNKPLHRLPIAPISVIDELASDPRGDAVVVGYSNYTTRTRWMSYDASSNRMSPTGIPMPTAPAGYSAVIAERFLVPSLDGTVRIPLEIVRRKDTKLNGSAPTILYAYGAYGALTQPSFSSSRLAWLERGGISAYAMIRGGGEYGESWHQAARRATKYRSSDDLAACARWLAAHGYASQRHLGIRGGSAGGYLMGLALTRNPNLYRAVDSSVGIYDQLRFELTPNGAFNTPEFGTVKDPAQFAFMLRFSPYHNVVKGTPYPAVLMTTGENDPRVDPANSRKMVARLQAASSSGNPILLIQRAGQGHGIGNSFAQNVLGIAEYLTFLDTELR